MTAKTKTKTVRISAQGIDRLREVARVHGMTQRQYLEALMHYAISQYERPGSWEAQGFDPQNYRPGFDETGFPLGCADRWFQ